MCAPEKQFFNWDRSPKSISLGYRHRPVADIRMPAAEGGCNRCVWIYVAMKAQPREVDWGLRVFNQSAARTPTDISCNRTEAPTPFPLATDSGPRWRCREAAWGAGGHGPGQLRLRDSHGVNSLLYPARWKYVQKMRATCPQLLHLVSLQSAAN